MTLLFEQESLVNLLTERFAALRDVLLKIPPEQFLNAREDDLQAHVLRELGVEAIVLNFDAATVEEHETKVDVADSKMLNPFRDPGPIYAPAIGLKLSVPFTGDPELFRWRPNPWSYARIRAEVRDGVVTIESQRYAAFSEDDLAQALGETKSELIECIARQAMQIQTYNNSLRAVLTRAIADRRAHLEKLHGAAARLGLPIRRTQYAPKILPAPLQFSSPALPPVPRTGFAPEVVIADDQYNEILGTNRQAARTLEQMPEAFSVLQEEGLRDFLVAGLNWRFPGVGGPTAETFRKSGKVDILVEAQSRHAFLAECKIWSGPASLRDAITQLLRYHTWRDCKSAVVMFNNSVSEFSKLLGSLEAVLLEHPNFVRTLTPFDLEMGEGRYLMRSIEDPGRSTEMHIFVFNLFFTASATKSRKTRTPH